MTKIRQIKNENEFYNRNDQLTLMVMGLDLTSYFQSMRFAINLKIHKYVAKKSLVSRGYLLILNGAQLSILIKRTNNAYVIYENFQSPLRIHRGCWLIS